ncbi:MAG TPA: glycoside hydrolase family 3 protein [Micromonospora sp.]|nr:glycoside hydrolase family 3 protein [Micromonospora sp.]
MAGVSPRWRRKTVAFAALAALAIPTGCGTVDNRRHDPPTSPIETSDPAAAAAALVREFTDEDLVGQVLMPYAYGSSATEVSSGSAAGNRTLAGVDTPAEMVARYRLGGMILVGFSADDPTSDNQVTTNVDNPQQVRDLTRGLQKAADGLAAGRLPMLIGTDQEFGVVTRVKDGMTLLPSAMAIAAAGDPALTEAAWRAAGTELAAVGINVDFAPVADVLGADSKVIGSRSYGSDPKAAAEQVAGAVRGLQGAGVAATLKHFPGHGHTTVDSHHDLPVLSQSRAALAVDDLPPFVAGIDAGAWLVMSGHLDVQAIDPGTAATFSRKVLTDLLRGELRFDGVVVSDALNMAPAMRWSAGEAAVRALNAGNDLLLMPPDVSAAYEGLLAALRDGRLSRDRLVESVTRVLTLKFRLADHSTPPPMSVLGDAAHQEAAHRIAAASVTVLRGPCDAPLVQGPVTVTSSGGRDGTRALLTAALRESGVEVIDSGGTIVHLVGYGDGPDDLRKDAAVTVAMDLPYLLGKARSTVLLATYSSSAVSMAALADVLAGGSAPTGRSPVAVSGLPRSACTT